MRLFGYISRGLDKNAISLKVGLVLKNDDTRGGVQHMGVDMEKVVLYGLGKEYSQLKAYLENNYDVIALCDKKIWGDCLKTNSLTSFK